MIEFCFSKSQETVSFEQGIYILVKNFDNIDFFFEVCCYSERISRLETGLSISCLSIIIINIF